MAIEEDEVSVVCDADRLQKFVVDVFRALGLTESNARDATAVLLKADIFGIESHGVPRLRNYVTRLQTGAVETNPEVVVVHELPSTALVMAQTGLVW